MARTPSEFTSELAGERRQLFRSLRLEIRKNLPAGYVERGDPGGMLTYEIPLSRYPNTYNGKPLFVAGLGSHKSYVTVYLMAVYGDKQLEAWFNELYAASGKKPHMGKSCVHFRTMEEVPTGVIGKAIAKVPVKTFIEIYERAQRGRA